MKPVINPEWLALEDKPHGELLIANPDCYKSINVGPPPNLVPVQEQTPHSRHLCKTETKVKKDKMKRTEVVGTITAKDRIPKGRYILRVCGTKFGPSGSSGNPMITLEYEILGTGDGKDVVEVGDRKINVAGHRIRQYYVTASVADPSATGEWMGRVFDLFAACGIPKDEIDENNPPHGELLNAVVDAILYSKKDPKFADPTPEDLAAGRKTGSPITDASGQPLEFFKVEIDKLLGPCQYEGNRVF